MVEADANGVERRWDSTKDISPPCDLRQRITGKRLG